MRNESIMTNVTMENVIKMNLKIAKILVRETITGEYFPERLVKIKAFSPQSKSPAKMAATDAHSQILMKLPRNFSDRRVFP